MQKPKDVLLIGPYNPAGIRTGQYLSPPFGIHRIASYLEKEGVARVDVADPTLDYDETIRMVRGKRYDIIGHSILHPTLEANLRLAWEAHKISPDSLQIAGGQGAAFNAKDIVSKTPVKTVGRGFGEFLLKQMIEGKPLDEIKGLYLMSGDRMTSTGIMERITPDEFRDISLNMNFSRIPYSRYWAFMEQQYNREHIQAMKADGLLRTVRLTLSNFCPMGCTHCSSTNFLENQKLLFLNHDEIIHVMKQAIKAHPETETFYFCDDNFFLLRKEGILKLCELTKGLGKRYNLMLLGRVDEVDEETLVAMGKAGFRNHFYGIETFSNRLAQEDIRKVRSGTQDYKGLAKKMLHATLDAGITAQVSLMLFLPSSKQEDLEITIENTLDLIEAGARVTVFPHVEAYPGAEIMHTHELTFKEFDIEGEHFRVPHLVLPDDKDIRILAERSLKLKDELNKGKKWARFNGRIPQLVDSLHLFHAIYELSGKPTKRIDDLLNKF